MARYKYTGNNVPSGVSQGTVYPKPVSMVSKRPQAKKAIGTSKPLNFLTQKPQNLRDKDR